MTCLSSSRPFLHRRTGIEIFGGAKTISSEKFLLRGGGGMVAQTEISPCPTN